MLRLITLVRNVEGGTALLCGTQVFNQIIDQITALKFVDECVSCFLVALKSTQAFQVYLLKFNLIYEIIKLE